MVSLQNCSSIAAKTTLKSLSAADKTPTGRSPVAKTTPCDGLPASEVSADSWSSAAKAASLLSFSGNGSVYITPSATDHASVDSTPISLVEITPTPAVTVR